MRRHRDTLNIPQTLEALRMALGLSWSQLARELGVSYRSLCEYRRGDHRPGGETMLRICQLASTTPGGLAPLGQAPPTTPASRHRLGPVLRTLPQDREETVSRGTA